MTGQHPTWLSLGWVGQAVSSPMRVSGSDSGPLLAPIVRARAHDLVHLHAYVRVAAYDSCLVLGHAVACQQRE